MAVKITTAMASGTQPPSRNFSMLAENSVSVDQQEGREHRDRQRPLHFQPRTASANTRMVVTSMVPVTAMP